MTNAEARFNKSLLPRKPEGSLGRTAQDVHLDSHTAPELWRRGSASNNHIYIESMTQHAQKATLPHQRQQSRNTDIVIVIAVNFYSAVAHQKGGA